MPILSFTRETHWRVESSFKHSIYDTKWNDGVWRCLHVWSFSVSNLLSPPWSWRLVLFDCLMLDRFIYLDALGYPKDLEV